MPQEGAEMGVSTSSSNSNTLLRAMAVGLVSDCQKAIGAIILTAVLAMLFSGFVTGFLSMENIVIIGVQGAVLVLLALGQTAVILTEGIDLSSGMVLTLSGIISSILLRSHLGTISLLGGLATGFLFGLATGLLVAVLRFPPFIASLGTMSLAQGLSLVLTQGSSVPVEEQWYRNLAEGSVLGIHYPIWIAILLFLITFFIVHGTRLGSYIISLGGNREALRLAGINVTYYEVWVYVYNALLASLAGILLTARLNSAHPRMGFGMEFDAIAAVIVGGTAFTRGNGGVLSSLIGALMIAVLRNGMNLAGIDAFLQLPLVGMVIIIAMAGRVRLQNQ